jgi:hypothetical protein
VSAGSRSNLKGHGGEAAKRFVLTLPPLSLFAYFLQGHLSCLQGQNYRWIFSLINIDFGYQSLASPFNNSDYLFTFSSPAL